MNQKKSLAILIIGGILLVIVATMAVLFYWRGSQATAGQYFPQTLLVNLTRPLNGSKIALGETISIAAEADGFNPIQSLEFWVDGVLVETTNTQNPELKQLNGLWNWTPDKEGRFTLIARGRDAHGQTVMSNPAVITVDPAEPVTVIILPKTGDTLTDLAQKFNMDAGVAAELNPNIDPAARFKEDQPMELVLPAGNFPKAGNAGGTSINPEIDEPSSPKPIPTMNPGGDKSKPPLPPHVNYEMLDGCNIQITVSAGSDNTDEFHLYLIRPGEDKSSMVYGHGPLGKGESFNYVENNAYGTYQVYAEAVNPAGFASSDPITISVDKGGCSPYAKAAVDVKVISRRLMSALYCFMTIDHKTYIRAPMGADSFIVTMSKDALNTWAKKALPDTQLMARSGFDLTYHLPAIYPKGSGTSHIKFECWDWEREINLGTVEKDFTDDELKTSILLSNEEYDVVGIFSVYPNENENQVRIGTPFNFKSTGDPNLCAKHETLAMCETYIKIGMATFVWDFKQGKCFPGTEAWCHFTDIDGFRIYRQYKTGEPPQWAYGVHSKEKVTAGFTQWPSQPDCNFSTVKQQITCLIANTPCYTVRAFKGSIESPDSNEVCLGDQAQTTGIITKTFTPSNNGTRLSEYAHNFSAADPNYLGWLVTDDTVASGYWEIDNLAKDYFSYRDYYGLFMFDLNEIMGKSIQTATLSFDKVYSAHELNGIPVSGNNCVRALGVSKAKFFFPGIGQQGPPYYKIYSSLPDINTGPLQYDVTDAVKSWSQGQLNTGFVLDGRDKVWPAPAVISYCLNKFGNIKLDVTYFNQ